MPLPDKPTRTAHLGHVELLGPRPEESLRFFTDVLGMTITAREAQSVYLRGWRDYERCTVKLTEAAAPGVAHIAFRAASSAALEAVASAGLGGEWVDGDVGHGAAYSFRDPDGHRFEVYWETESYRPDGDASVFVNQAARSTARGAAVAQIDHVNLMSRDVGASRAFAADALGCRLSEQLLTPDGHELGAWLRVTSKAYDLTYTADRAPVGDRLHHLALRVDTREEVLRAADLFAEHGIFIELGPARHDIGGTFFVYVYEPSGNRIEVCAGGYLIFSPDWQPAVWTVGEGDRFQAWNTPFVSSFMTYATPDAGGG
jgi:catechol 2,3-dioxygenase